MEDTKSFFHHNHPKGALKAVLSLLLVTLIVYISVGISNQIKTGRYIGQGVVSRNTITVSGTGEIYAKPDLAITSFTVKTEAKAVEEAIADNTEKMNAIVEAMKGAGIEDKDLKTTDFNIYPRYEYRADYSVEYWPKPEKRVLVGYEVSQSLEVKIRDMVKIGDIIQKAVDAGANQAGELQFTFDDPDGLKNQAREEAIKEAKEKAGLLAKQLGVKLTKITNFSEGGYYPTPMYYDSAMSAKEIGGSESIPQIETGENKITVNISITYEIN
ncbi:SIMPL domain-containing protein [Patescibacteria group bacterium]|nr:SIMPL domain-containing protein [Patescibacteria group bacterium]